jgi:hypothetical protein
MDKNGSLFIWQKMAIVTQLSQLKIGNNRSKGRGKEAIKFLTRSSRPKTA